MSRPLRAVCLRYLEFIDRFDDLLRELKDGRHRVLLHFQMTR
jgi:hypothetical protein